MQTLLKRIIAVDSKQIKRHITIRGGKATIRHQNQIKEVAPIGGNYLDKQTVWRITQG
jgi:hypothetical protein